MLPHARSKIGRAFILQADNDPKHSSHLVKTWLNNKRIITMEWPSQSPDLNPIEHLWGELGRRCATVKTKNKMEKFQLLEKEWAAIPQAVIDDLLNSMPRRCQ